MPYVLERADKLWAERSDNSFGTSLPNPPTSYIPGRVYGCIFDDETGPARTATRIGMDQICFETDYPHADSTFPHSKKVADEICAQGRAGRGRRPTSCCGATPSGLRPRALRHHRA